jgi:hypothetical protein
MLSMSEHREIVKSVNNMENDYNVLKSELEEFTKVAENLAHNLAKQEAYIHLIKVKIDELDKSKIALDAIQECRLRNYLDMAKGKRLSMVTFIKEEPMYEDGYFDEYEQDPVIMIKDACSHETIITSLSKHAFDICREVLGEPLQNQSNRTWILRTR